MVLIGISGKKGSGKDTVAELIESITLRKTYIVGFADEVKNEVAKATGVTTEFIEKNKAQFRTVLQWWGTEFRKHFVGEDYWIIKTGKHINSLPTNENDLVIIKDVRFHSELSFIQRVGGIMIRVEREAVEKDSHLSETALDGHKFEYVIENNGTKEELRTAVTNILKSINIIPK